MLSHIKRFLRSEEGPTTVEYAVMLALIVAVVIGTVAILGNKTSDLVDDMTNELDAAAGGP